MTANIVASLVEAVAGSVSVTSVIRVEGEGSAARGGILYASERSLVSAS